MSKKLTAIIVVVILAGGIIFLAGRSKAPATDSSSPSSASSTQSPSAAVASQMVSSVQLATTLAKDGTAINPTAAFSTTTPKIYAVLSLNGIQRKTQIAYIRYYQGKYVDSKVAHPSADGAKNFHFTWKLKAGKTRKPGTYTLVFYVNGKKAQTVSYSVR